MDLHTAFGKEIVIIYQKDIHKKRRSLLQRELLPDQRQFDKRMADV